MRGGFQPCGGLSNRDCIICDESFLPYRDTDKTCSKACRKTINLQDQKIRKYPSQSHFIRRKRMAEWRRKNPAKRILSTIRSRCPETDLDEDWLNERLELGVCEITGLPFEEADYGSMPPGFNHNPWTASVDRIDPKKSYMKNNCRLVVWCFNRARGLWEDDIILTMARALAEKNK